VTVAPHNGFANGNLGAVLLERGQWDEAMIHLDEALHDVPNLTTAQFDMALAFYEKARYGEAEAGFRRSVAMQPFDAASHFFLGMTYDHTGRIPQAIEEVSYAIRLKPDAENYHFALGVMLRESGDKEGARAAFLEELQLNPQHRAAIQQLQEMGASPQVHTAAPAK
jgi:tetratricopeptide (TPR) repeat protein